MPWRHHYLDLDPTYKDTYGLPQIRITYDFEDQDREMVKFMAAKSAEIMQEMKPSKVGSRGAWPVQYRAVPVDA